jgi:hypothetical protein
MELDDLHSASNLEKMKFLKDNDYDKFMRVLYKSIESFPERIKTDPFPLESRIAALYKVIDYFKGDDIQEFKKCAIIQNIINELEQDDIPSSSK